MLRDATCSARHPSDEAVDSASVPSLSDSSLYHVSSVSVKRVASVLARRH